jgi:hypothetical protein
MLDHPKQGLAIVCHLASVMAEAGHTMLHGLQKGPLQLAPSFSQLGTHRLH